MLHINDLTYRIGGRIILDSASAALPDRARVGLVGRNGAGKTTLLRLVQGELAPDDGAVSVPRRRRVGGVAQEAPAGPEALIDVVLAADTERARLIAEAEQTTDPMRRAEIETRLFDIDSHSAPARAAAVLHGLGFDSDAQARPCASFSGGWRMRVALAALLFSQPDLLLLDEPTNYLDIEGTLWLHDYLARYPHTVLAISHDRDFLDTVVDHILFLERGKLSLWRGGFTSFDRQRRESIALRAAAWRKQEAERRHLQSFVDRFRAKASKARQAQSRIKRLERLEPISDVVDETTLPFDLGAPPRPLAPPLLAMEDVATGYDGLIVLERLNITLAPDDRIALLGQNGNGKSTFAKLLSGRLSPLMGEMRRSPKLTTAYFAQHQLDELEPGATPLQHIAKLMPGAPEAKIRARAAKIGFPAVKADTRVSSLSGGEKARLLLGLSAFAGPHLLILDEPTNHLDIGSRQALMEAINDYPGAVVLISHDRFLVEACVDRLWLVANRTVAPFDGDLDDYRRLVLATEKSSNRTDGQREGSHAQRRRRAAERRETAAPLQKRADALEASMGRLTAVIAKVDAALASPESFAKNPGKANELSRMRAEAVAALARVEDDWLEISKHIEAAREQGLARRPDSGGVT